MLERFKDYAVVCVKFESLEERKAIIDYLKKNDYRSATLDNSLNKCILRINQDSKTIWCADKIEISNQYDKNVVFIQGKDIITLDMKKQMYLTKEQLECIDYVDAELKEYEITDLYVDDFGLMVKARGIYDSRIVENSFEDFFDICIVKEIEEHFYNAMVRNYDSLDHDYKMLALSRKCMRELK